MDSFLKVLEENCPGDDAHDGLGESRPLLERCGMCRTLYDAHLAAVLHQVEVLRKALERVLDGCFCNGVNNELPDCQRCVEVRAVLTNEK